GVVEFRLGYPITHKCSYLFQGGLQSSLQFVKAQRDGSYPASMIESVDSSQGRPYSIGQPLFVPYNAHEARRKITSQNQTPSNQRQILRISLSNSERMTDSNIQVGSIAQL